MIYPRDLRYRKIINFTERLSAKISATVEKFEKDDNYKSFLKSFGTFKVSTLAANEVSMTEFMERKIDEIQKLIGV